MSCQRVFRWRVSSTALTTGEKLRRRRHARRRFAAVTKERREEGKDHRQETTQRAASDPAADAVDWLSVRRYMSRLLMPADTQTTTTVHTHTYTHTHTGRGADRRTERQTEERLTRRYQCLTVHQRVEQTARRSVKRPITQCHAVSDLLYKQSFCQ